MLVFDSTGSRPLWRVSKVARWLKKDTRTIRWYIKTGKLPAVRLGNLWFIDSEAIKAFRPRCQPRKKEA